MRNVLFICLILICISCLEAQDIQVSPCDDMYTDCLPNGPNHNEEELFLVYESAAEQEQIMIKFDLSGVQGITIESATLNLHRYFSCGAGGGITTSNIYLISEDWNEESWDPHTFIQFDLNSGFPYIFSGPSLSQNTWFEIDISNFVDLWVYENQPNFGLVIIADSGQRHSKFNSKEASNPDFRPYLTLSLPTSADDPIESSIISLSNFPNPFNPSTTIHFNLPGFERDNTAIEITNVKGQLIKTIPIYSLTDQPINSVTWNGTDNSNQPVSSGIYFYKLISGRVEKTNKMILMK